MKPAVQYTEGVGIYVLGDPKVAVAAHVSLDFDQTPLTEDGKDNLDVAKENW